MIVQTLAETNTTVPEQPIFELIEVEQVFEVPKPGRSIFSRETVGLRALDGVRLNIRKGTSLAVVGESGSGKSTLLRVLLGLDRPSGGRALYNSKPILEGRATGIDFARDVLSRCAWVTRPSYNDWRADCRTASALQYRIARRRSLTCCATA